MAQRATLPSAKGPADSPYKLEPAQVLKASEALLKHMRESRKQNEATANKKNLLTAGNDSEEEDDGNSSEAVWLIVTTKKHITDKASLKPRRIPVPNTLNVSSAVSSICLITPNPQRAFKDVIAHASFPAELREKIRIRGAEKVKARFKSFEQKRQLYNEHDVFLADDRVITMMSGLLGKVFYKGTTKRPLPVTLSAPRPKDANGKTIKAEKKILSNKRTKGNDEPQTSVANPEAFAREIERVMSSTHVHMSPSVTTAVRVGFSSFSAEQLAENVEATVNGIVEKVIPKQWRNVKALHIKGPNSTALPIWLADEMWVEEEDVLEDEHAAALENTQGRKRKDRDEVQDGGVKPKRLEAGISDRKSGGFSKEMIERREKLRQQKREAKQSVAAGI